MRSLSAVVSAKTDSHTVGIMYHLSIGIRVRVLVVSSVPTQCADGHFIVISAL